MKTSARCCFWTVAHHNCFPLSLRYQHVITEHPLVEHKPLLRSQLQLSRTSRYRVTVSRSRHRFAAECKPHSALVSPQDSVLLNTWP